MARCIHELDARDVRELTAMLAKVPLQHWRSTAAGGVTAAAPSSDSEENLDG